MVAGARRAHRVHRCLARPAQTAVGVAEPVVRRAGRRGLGCVLRTQQRELGLSGRAVRDGRREVLHLRAPRAVRHRLVPIHDHRPVPLHRCLAQQQAQPAARRPKLRSARADGLAPCPALRGPVALARVPALRDKPVELAVTHEAIADLERRHVDHPAAILQVPTKFRLAAPAKLDVPAAVGQELRWAEVDALARRRRRARPLRRRVHRRKMQRWLQ
mmetsp:Transcript_15236/g.47526  ORF Transcript_15236/g.47526 Transcript_15236/m.47526 type:complete len:217 (+) Transcript_15236:319-969(+)